MIGKVDFFRNLFSPRKSKNIQSADIDGSHNKVIQINIAADASDETRRMVIDAVSREGSDSFGEFITESHDEDSDEDLAAIIQYRSIANEGNAAVALELLEALGEKENYKSGYRAFKLNLNIGMVLQNIGEVEKAATKFQAAYKFFPDNPKAQAALAFARLLEGEPQDAFDLCLGIIRQDGNHKPLASTILLHSAIAMRAVVDLDETGINSLDHPDVVTAKLRYLQELEPDSFHNIINKEYRENENKDVASIWALHVLGDAKTNQAFLLGALMPDRFENDLIEAAEIMVAEATNALDDRPPNITLLASQANNAVVSLRLLGRQREASKLLEKILDKVPSIKGQLSQIGAVLLLQEDKDSEALALIDELDASNELNLMAAEIEAKYVDPGKALTRIDRFLSYDSSAEMREQALSIKTRIAIFDGNQEIADAALDEMMATYPRSQSLLLLKSSYARKFTYINLSEDSEKTPIASDNKTDEDQRLIQSISKANEWDFATRLQVAEELLIRGYYRESSDLLRDNVSYNKESPALTTLCSACLHGHLGSLAKEIAERLSPTIRNTTFGWKFLANVSYLNGEIAKSVPYTQRLYENNKKSIGALDWYVQSLLRVRDRNRISRLVKNINDEEMIGAVKEKSDYVNLLVYCGEVERARNYAYRLFCEHRHEHQSWMALTAAVLGFNRAPGSDNGLDIDTVGDNTTVELSDPNGEVKTYTIETDRNLLPFKSENISPSHPIAVAVKGRKTGEKFAWPLGNSEGEAIIISVKSKVLAAFHQVTRRFEEQFPDAQGFKTVSIATDSDDQFKELTAFLQQRANYAQGRAKEYLEGAYPLCLLGHQLGLDPIDAFLSIYAECGVHPKVSSCSHLDQIRAGRALQRGSKGGVILDATAIYLIRRWGIEKEVFAEFGQIGYTQATSDILSKRLNELEASGMYDSIGSRRIGTAAVENGQILYTEFSSEVYDKKLSIVRGDMEWLSSDACILVASVPKSDPADVILRFRNEVGGKFIDDIFAADGSGRVLISDDLFVRKWASEILNVESSWLQAMVFHLEENGRLSREKVVEITVSLIGIGEQALSISGSRLLVAMRMLKDNKISRQEIGALFSLVGQPGADLQSHLDVTALLLTIAWGDIRYVSVRATVSSIILNALIRHQGENSPAILSRLDDMIDNDWFSHYLEGWRKGHFI